MEPLSLDEAFLDVAGSERLFGSAVEIGRAIKQAIQQRLQLVASVGVAPNKFLAKIASDLGKPDGFVVVEPGQEQPFLDPLPVGRLWGVGKVTGAVFARQSPVLRNWPRPPMRPRSSGRPRTAWLPLGCPGDGWNAGCWG